jgi:hypothetical protein
MSKGDKKMNAAFKEFVNTNNDKIRKISKKNSTRNSEGLVVISKNDSWRNETEWDDFFEDKKNK